MGMSRLVLLTWSKSVAWTPNYMALFGKGEVLWSPGCQDLFTCFFFFFIFL